MDDIWYPSIEDSIEANKIAVTVYKAVKKECFGLLSQTKIIEAINYAKNKKGDVKIKASALLLGFSDKHPFSSGNRRTGYLLMNQFLGKNAGYMIAKKREFVDDLFKKIRREIVKEENIADWYDKTRKRI
jgi:prophage maintenance system killer protein